MGAQSNVLELCSQVNHVRDSHEGHAPALGDAEVAARGRIDALEHSAGESRARYGFLQGVSNRTARTGFGQVVHGIDLKRLDRVAVVRSDENDGGRPLQDLQVSCEFDSAHFGHVDVDQDDLRFAGGDDLQALHAVRRFARNGVRQLCAAVLQKFAQTVARRFLVVDDDHAERSHRLVR